jgi:hypothetical protein
MKLIQSDLDDIIGTLNLTNKQDEELLEVLPNLLNLKKHIQFLKSEPSASISVICVLTSCKNPVYIDIWFCVEGDFISIIAFKKLTQKQYEEYKGVSLN